MLLSPSALPPCALLPISHPTALNPWLCTDSTLPSNFNEFGDDDMYNFDSSNNYDASDNYNVGKEGDQVGKVASPWGQSWFASRARG